MDSIAVFLKNKADVRIARRVLDRTLAPLAVDVIENGTLRREAVAVFGGAYFIEVLLGAIVIANAIFGVVTTLFALVLERQDDIRTLRRVGVATSLVSGAVLVESLLIGALSTLLGVCIGIALGRNLVFGLDRQPYGGNVVWQFPTATVLWIALGVIGCCALAALYPARLAARLPALATGE